MVVDAGLPRAQADAEILAARRFYAFWSTGEPRYLDAAIAPTRASAIEGLPRADERVSGVRRPGVTGPRKRDRRAAHLASLITDAGRSSVAQVVQ